MRFPFEPAPSVVERALPHFAERPRHRARPLVVGVLAAAVVASGALAVSPTARSEVRGWLDALPGVDVERVEALPSFPADAAPPFLGEPVTLDAARTAVDWDLRLPVLDELGAPSEVYFRNDVPGGIVTLVYGLEPRARLSEWRGSISSASFQLESGTSLVESVAVRGGEGVWLEGHVQATYTFVGADGGLHREALPVAGNVLLWQEGAVAFRLETAASKENALAVAESVAP